MGREISPPPKIAPFLWELWAPTRYVVPWAPRVHTTNGTLIGSSVFLQLAVVTNRQTDRETMEHR